MANIFVSYTANDRDWAFWIGNELDTLGHKPHIHEWEIPGGGDIAAWMEKTHSEADHILCVLSKAYFDAPYSAWERRAAQWAAAKDRPGFVLPVFVEDCNAPTLFSQFKHCDLFGLGEDQARASLARFLEPAAKPNQRPAFPGRANSAMVRTVTQSTPPFPGDQSPDLGQRRITGDSPSVSDNPASITSKPKIKEILSKLTEVEREPFVGFFAVIGAIVGAFIGFSEGVYSAAVFAIIAFFVGGIGALVLYHILPMVLAVAIALVLGGVLYYFWNLVVQLVGPSR